MRVRTQTSSCAVQKLSQILTIRRGRCSVRSTSFMFEAPRTCRDEFVVHGSFEIVVDRARSRGFSVSRYRRRSPRGSSESPFLRLFLSRTRTDRPDNTKRSHVRGGRSNGFETNKRSLAVSIFFPRSARGTSRTQTVITAHAARAHVVFNLTNPSPVEVIRLPTPWRARVRILLK